MRDTGSHSRPFFVFLGILFILMGVSLSFVQSKYFANIIKKVAKAHMPSDFGIEGDFKELQIKLFPPGVIIKNPSVILKAKNIVGLPAGTVLNADSLDINFQLFQLLTGGITINTLVIDGASLKLSFDESFFHQLERQKILREKKNFLSWKSFVGLRFRSISLLNSKLDIGMERATNRIHLQTFAKEFTIATSHISRIPSYEISMDFKKTYVETPLISQSLSQLQASVGVSIQGITIRSLGMQEGEMSVAVNGKIQGDVLNPQALKSDLHYLIKGPLEKWFDQNLFGRFILPIEIFKKNPLTGNVNAEGEFTADLMSFPQTLETRATVLLEKFNIAGWEVEQAKFKGFWKPFQAVIESADFKIDEGDLHISKVSYNINNPRSQVQAAIHFQRVDFRKIMGSFLDSVYPLHMRISGDANLGILFPTKKSTFNLEGTTDFNLQHFSFDNQSPHEEKPLKVLISVPEISLQSKFTINSRGLWVKYARVKLPQTQLEAQGIVDGKSGFNLDILGQVHLADLGKLSTFKITGDGPLHWTITGKKPDVFFTFDTSLKQASYLNLDLGNAQGKIIWDDARDTLSFEKFTTNQGRTKFIANGDINLGKTDDVNLTVQVPRGTIQDFAEVFSGFLDQSVPWYPEDLTGQMTGVIRVTGKTDLKLLSAMGDMEVSNINYKNELFRQGHLHLGFRRGSYVAENVKIRKKTGWLFGNIILGEDNFLKFDIHSEGLSTTDIDRLTRWDLSYHAPLSLESSGSGWIENLQSSFKLSVGAGTLKNRHMEPCSIDWKLEKKRLHGTASIFNKQAVVKLDYGFEKNAVDTLDIETTQFNFLPLFAFLNPNLMEDTTADSNIEGKAHIQFQSPEFALPTGVFDLKTFELKRPGYSLALTKAMHIEMKQGNYQFGSVQVQGDETDLKFKGRSENGQIHNDLTGSINLGLLSFFIPQISSIHGAAQIEALLYGQVDKPHIKVHLGVKDADARLQRFDQPFEDIRAHVTWEDASLILDDLETKFADGKISGHGELKWVDSRIPQTNFQFLLDNPKIQFYPVSYARTSGKLIIKGTEFPYKVTGNLKIAEAFIKENFSLNEGSRLLRSSKFFPSKGVDEIQVFDLDVNLSSDQGIFIRNDLFDAELKGNLEILHSTYSPILLGNLSVVRGKLLFKNNYFWIQSGSMKFNNPSALDPEFDLIGQMEMKGYKIILVSSGKVSDYKLTFESQPPLSQNDIVSLLTLGVTSSDYHNISVENRDAYSRDAMYSLLFSQSGINKGFEEKLGVKLRLDQSQMVLPENVFRTRSNTDLNGTVSPKVVMQKDITDNLRASAGTTVGVGDTKGQDLNLEYGVGRHWSLLGIYEDQRGTQPGETYTSVGPDLKFKLRFK